MAKVWIRKRHPRGHWDIKENCLKESLKFASKEEWKTKSQTAHIMARRHGWFEECTAHMIPKFKPKNFWLVKKNCVEVARLCKNREEWASKYSQSHKYAHKLGWQPECCAHIFLHH